MPASRFLPEVEAALKNAGWFPGRTTPVEQLSQWYLLESAESAGHYRIFPAAFNALVEFGGLTIAPIIDGTPSETLAIEINPLSAFGQFDEEWFTYQWALNTSLFPLGTIADDGEKYVLSIDLQGNIYTIAYELMLVASSLDDAINQLLTGSDDSRDCELPGELLEQGAKMYHNVMALQKGNQDG